MGVSLEGEIYIVNKHILTFPVFYGKKVLIHVVILIYFLYLNPKAYHVPILLVFNISKNNICSIEHESHTLLTSMQG